MNANPPSGASAEARSFPWGLAILGTVVLWLGLCAVGIAGMFRHSAEVAALRESLMSSTSGAWEKTISVRVGGIVTGLVRLGAGFFPLDPEPRAALAAVRGGEVGVYQLRDGPGWSNPGAILSGMDKEMTRRGWVRGVGVVEPRQLVAVYFPKRKLSISNVRCCVVVLQERELVLASVRGNLDPLWQIASEHIDWPSATRKLKL